MFVSAIWSVWQCNRSRHTSLADKHCYVVLLRDEKEDRGSTVQVFSTEEDFPAVVKAEREDDN